jgi:3-methyladenine DNA glycosylase AlkD
MDKADVLAWLEQHGSTRVADGMARYGIASADRVAGVSVGDLKKLAKQIGKDHNLAAELWASGWYEARLLAAFVDDPPLVTRRQMNAWAAAFDNWATCDHACFHLFDRTPLAWEAAPRWTKSPREFVKRAGFALMASLALHDKAADDDRFLAFLPLIERGASDERNFVKKGVSWALRSIGRRPGLRAAALDVARRLAASAAPAARWVGKDAVRDLTKKAR